MIWAITILSLVFISVIAYLGIRFVCALEAMVHVLQKRQSVGGYSISSSAEVGKASKPIAELPELPPEIIAPNLAKPPRPRGGFGSPVRTNDNISIQQRSESEKGSQSSEAGGGKSDQAPSDSTEADKFPKSSGSTDPSPSPKSGSKRTGPT